MSAATFTRLRLAAEAYYRLCDEAARLGLPVSLDDPASPVTVDGLRAAVEAARA